VAFRSWVWGW